MVGRGDFSESAGGLVRTERTRSWRPGSAAKVGAGDTGSGDAGRQGDVAGWWSAVGPVPSPGGLEGGRFKRVPTAGDGIRN